MILNTGIDIVRVCPTRLYIRSKTEIWSSDIINEAFYNKCFVLQYYPVLSIHVIHQLYCWWSPSAIDFARQEPGMASVSVPLVAVLCDTPVSCFLWILSSRQLTEWTVTSLLIIAVLGFGIGPRH